MDVELYKDPNEGMKEGDWGANLTWMNKQHRLTHTRWENGCPDQGNKKTNKIIYNGKGDWIVDCENEQQEWWAKMN